MGNFLGCFGRCDDSGKPRKQKNHVIPPEHQRHVFQGIPESSISGAAQSFRGTPPANLVSQDSNEEKLNLSPRKRVTFDENVTTYEHVSVYESTENFLEKTKTNEEEKLEDKPSQFSSSTEEDSVVSSIGSYPSNHRYQSCQDSDDDDEDAFGNSDTDDEDEIEDAGDYSDNDGGDDEGRMLVHEIWSESVLTASVESSSRDRKSSEEAESPVLNPVAEPKGYVSDRTVYVHPVLNPVENLSHEIRSESVLTASVESSREAESPVLNPVPEPKGYVRDRSIYVHPVLNPVENLSQWKALKSKARIVAPHSKENFPIEPESSPRSPEPTFKRKSSNRSNEHDRETGVNASLSNWLVSSETATPMTNFSRLETDETTVLLSPSRGSNPATSFEDRPILGALTVEELKHFSPAASSPSRSRSRSRSPEIPIIGTVGTYWNPSGGSENDKFGSVSSFKGIPNTTSKYKEDKRVNWHSTPFETRLERALNRGAAEA